MQNGVSRLEMHLKKFENKINGANKIQNPPKQIIVSSSNHENLDRYNSTMTSNISYCENSYRFIPAGHNVSQPRKNSILNKSLQ